MIPVMAHEDLKNMELKQLRAERSKLQLSLARMASHIGNPCEPQFRARMNAVNQLIADKEKTAKQRRQRN
jgi:hypothetical protein